MYCTGAHQVPHTCGRTQITASGAHQVLHVHAGAHQVLLAALADDEEHQKQPPPDQAKTHQSARIQARLPACSSPLPPWAEFSSRDHDRQRARADKARSAFAFSLKATRRPRRPSAAEAAPPPAQKRRPSPPTPRSPARAHPPTSNVSLSLSLSLSSVAMRGQGTCRQGKPGLDLSRPGVCAPVHSLSAHAKARHLENGVAPYPPAWGDRE